MPPTPAHAPRTARHDRARPSADRPSRSRVVPECRRSSKPVTTQAPPIALRAVRAATGLAHRGSHVTSWYHALYMYTYREGRVDRVSTTRTSTKNRLVRKHPHSHILRRKLGARRLRQILEVLEGGRTLCSAPFAFRICPSGTTCD